MDKINQSKICKQAQISNSMLSQILSGKRTAGWRTAKSLSMATGTDPLLWLEGSLDQIKSALELIQKKES